MVKCSAAEQLTNAFKMPISGLDIPAGAGGGAILAASASTLLLLGGQITGISGFVNTFAIKEGRHHPVSWRGLYISALAGTGLLAALLGYGDKAFGQVTLKPWVSAIAGLAVGVGTRLANGCTSGHGLCGLPRLSVRSLVATCSFMASGMMMASFVRNVPAVRDVLFAKAPIALSDILPAALAKSVGTTNVPAAALLAVASVLAVPVVRLALNFAGRISDSFSKAASKKSEEKEATAVVITQHASSQHAMHMPSLGAAALALACGGTFATGLIVSGMTNPTVVQSFLDPFGSYFGGWNPTLAFVMGAGVLVNLLAFKYASSSNAAPMVPLEHHHAHHLQQSCPVKPLKEHLSVGNVPANMKIDRHLLAGSLLFGLGWGLAGVCPGPGIAAFGAGTPTGIVFVPSMLVGMALLHFLQLKGIVAGAGAAPAAPAGAVKAAAPSASLAADSPAVTKEDKKPLLGDKDKDNGKDAHGHKTTSAGQEERDDGSESDSDDEDG